MASGAPPVLPENGAAAARDAWLTTAVALYTMATTVSFASTTLSSRAFIEPVRLLALGAALGIASLVFLQRLRLARGTVLGIVVYGVALCYGVMLASANGGMVHISEQLAADVVLALTGIYLFSSIGQNILPTRAVLLYLVFAGVVLALTIAVGGFTMAYPPQFTYEYAASEAGVAIYYSQGVSKFFGLAAIAAIFVAFSAPSRIVRLLLFGVCLGALGLSLIGGARGDSVAAALIVLAYSSYRSPGSLLIWLGAVGGAVLFLQGTIVLEDFMIFNRLMNLQDDVGLREILLRQAAQLLAEQPACLTVGCGFGFFQRYYGYDSGLYPHNIALEAAIVWGIPLVLATAVLVFFGFVTYLRRSRSQNDAFVLFYAYFLFLFLKSGTILGAWFVLGGSIHFLGITLGELVRHRQVRPQRRANQGRELPGAAWQQE